jgi:hypothetical protein
MIPDEEARHRAETITCKEARDLKAKPVLIEFADLVEF